ncbi:MAG: ABC transporter substrate-binding protein [Chloroflexota bacterium]
MKVSMRWPLVGLAALAVLAMVLLSACQAQQPAGSAGGAGGAKEVKIGFVGPLTGDSASDGISAKNGAEMAIEELNKANAVPGVKLTLVSYDDQNKSEQASSIAQKLIEQDKVVAVVDGSYSTPSRAAAPIFQRGKIPMIVAYAVHPEIAKAGDYVYRIIYVGQVQGKAMADYATGKLNYKKIAMLNVDNDYGKSIGEGFTAAMKDAGGAVPVSRTFSIGQKDFAPLITAVKDSNPDALYLVGYYAEASLLVQQARQLGFTKPILSTDGVDSPKFPELAGKDAEGVILTTDFSRQDPRPKVQDFIKNYKAKYGGGTPDFIAASSYDCVSVLADAIKRGGTTPDQIKNGLAQVKELEGVAGKVSFDANREVVKTIFFVKVDKGEFQYVDKLDLK